MLFSYYLILTNWKEEVAVQLPCPGEAHPEAVVRVVGGIGMACVLAPAVATETQRSGISLSLSLSVFLSLSLFLSQGPEERRLACPAHLTYLSPGPFFLRPLQEPCGLGFHPSDQGYMRSHRDLWRASRVLS